MGPAGEDGLDLAQDAAIDGPGELALSARSGAAELILVDVPLEFRPVGVWAR